MVINTKHKRLTIEQTTLTDSLERNYFSNNFFCHFLRYGKVLLQAKQVHSNAICVTMHSHTKIATLAYFYKYLHRLNTHSYHVLSTCMNGNKNNPILRSSNTPKKTDFNGFDKVKEKSMVIQ